jgi:hypothetical protein
MNQQTTPTSQRRQNYQNGCVKAWKLASDMNVIETKKQQENVIINMGCLNARGMKKMKNKNQEWKLNVMWMGYKSN